MPQKAKWTVLTYIAAHNNLDSLGRSSLQQILGVGSTPDVVHGVLYDGFNGAGRYLMGDPGYVAQQEMLGETDSGSPTALIETASWLFKAHPAERYGLVLWSHGTGWEPSEIESVARQARPNDPSNAQESKERSRATGSLALFRTTLKQMLRARTRDERAILFDDGTGHSLDTLELAQVVDSIAKVVGQPLELVGMDACLMASLEVAYQLRHCARYLVASQELVPGHSWPYQQIYGELRAAPQHGGGSLAKLIVDQYVKFYTANPPSAGDVTKVALDLGALSNITAAIDGFASCLLGKLEVNADLMWRAQEATQLVETRSGVRQPSKFDYHLWDAGTLADKVSSTTSDAALQTAARSLNSLLRPGAGPVLAEGHTGDWFDGISGVTVYLPRQPTRVSPHYADLAFAKDTQWGRFVQDYRNFYP